ncbi:hypothetical protein Tco_0655849 [Tanacetum coccineum]|uniref:Retrovirus-related Pol polyprotein from transposon TNT 1-94-like beta-barrel domain-containing protein n=1 Tax=Tanacetum coccineum TaxID=301880 RepID=A0ABQ4X747_9ASTR
MFLLTSQRLSATTVTEKGILLENVDLEGVKEEDLMVTMAGAMHQLMNLHHRHWWLKISSDDEHIPENNRFPKNGYKVIPPPITGNFLTLRADISFVGLDEYARTNKIIESQTTELNNKTGETAGKTNDANTEKPKSVNDEEEVFGVQKVRPETRDDKSGQNSHKQGVRPSISTARPVCAARPSISTARPVYASKPIYPRMDNVRPRGSCSPIKRSYYTKLAFRPKDLKQDVKTFGVKNITTVGKRAVVNTSKGKLDTDLEKSRWVWRPKGNPEILLQDHAVVDSGCSSHMTGNKAYLSDYEDFNKGFVAFGSDPKGESINKKRDCCAQISKEEGEEPWDSGRNYWICDDDPLVSLVRESMKENSIDFVTPTKASGEAQEEEISPTILEGRARSYGKKIILGLDAEDEINTGRVETNTDIEDVNTGSAKLNSGTASKRGQREGKSPMSVDEKLPKQIHLDEMIAKRMAKEEALSEQQKKRKAQVQFEAQFYTEEDWDAIRDKLEANAKLTKDMLGKDLPEQDFAKRMVDTVNQRKKHFAEERAKAKRNKPMTQSQLRIYKSNYLKNQGNLGAFSVKKLSFERN